MSALPASTAGDGDPSVTAGDAGVAPDPPVHPARSDTVTTVTPAHVPAHRRDPLMNPLVDSPARMANIKSQKKRNIQNEKRHQRNVATKSALKTSTKKVQ